MDQSTIIHYKGPVTLILKINRLRPLSPYEVFISLNNLDCKGFTISCPQGSNFENFLQRSSDHDLWTQK